MVDEDEGHVLYDDDDDDGARPMTEVEQINALRLNRAHPEIVVAEVDGKFSTLRFHSSNCAVF